jgi:hypothetical protein
MISQSNSAVFGIGLWLVTVPAFGQTTGLASTSTFSVYLPPNGLVAIEAAQVNVVNASPVAPASGAPRRTVALSRLVAGESYGWNSINVE